MLKRIINFHHTRPDLPLREGSPEDIRREYNRRRWMTFLTCTGGYAFFYTCRLSFSVAKPDMIASGLLDAQQAGLVGSALYFTYAFGKLTNGFLADRAHIGRFMGTGLLISAIVNLIFGYSSIYALFFVLWGINGWFQSMGSAPGVANLSAWFSNRERGTRYSIWSTAHSIGEGLTWALTATLVSALGWRAGLMGPGIASIIVALVMYRLIQDRPPTYGLPLVADFKDDHAEVKHDAQLTVAELQKMVIRNPWVWVLGLASAMLYIARYGVNSWMFMYFEVTKGYSKIDAGLNLTLLSVFNLVGSVSAGLLSDFLFRSRRPPVTLLYGLLLIGSLIAMFVTSPGHIWADRAAAAGCGFAIGGLLVNLGGLMAVDICPKRATGAAMGMVGVFSYLGAFGQDIVSGWLLDSTKTVVDGETVFDFTYAFYFWIGAAVLSLLLASSLWRVKHAD